MCTAYSNCRKLKAKRKSEGAGEKGFTTSRNKDMLYSRRLISNCARNKSGVENTCPPGILYPAKLSFKSSRNTDFLRQTKSVGIHWQTSPLHERMKMFFKTKKMIPVQTDLQRARKGFREIEMKIKHLMFRILN